MKARYRLTRRGSRGDKFYCVDAKSGKRTSLHTSDEDAATQIVHARNEAERQPLINLQLAKAYLATRFRQLMERGCYFFVRPTKASTVRPLERMRLRSVPGEISR